MKITGLLRASSKIIDNLLGKNVELASPKKRVSNAAQENKTQKPSIKLRLATWATAIAKKSFSTDSLSKQALTELIKFAKTLPGNQKIKVENIIQQKISPLSVQELSKLKTKLGDATWKENTLIQGHLSDRIQQAQQRMSDAMQTMVKAMALDHTQLMIKAAYDLRNVIQNELAPLARIQGDTSLQGKDKINDYIQQQFNEQFEKAGLNPQTINNALTKTGFQQLYQILSQLTAPNVPALKAKQNDGINMLVHMRQLLKAAEQHDTTQKDSIESFLKKPTIPQNSDELAAKVTQQLALQLEAPIQKNSKGYEIVGSMKTLSLTDTELNSCATLDQNMLLATQNDCEENWIDKVTHQFTRDIKGADWLINGKIINREQTGYPKSSERVSPVIQLLQTFVDDDALLKHISYFAHQGTLAPLVKNFLDKTKLSNRNLQNISQLSLDNQATSLHFELTKNNQSQIVLRISQNAPFKGFVTDDLELIEMKNGQFSQMVELTFTDDTSKPPIVSNYQLACYADNFSFT